jgi:hypothetical protein
MFGEFKLLSPGLYVLHSDVCIPIDLNFAPNHKRKQVRLRGDFYIASYYSGHLLTSLTESQTTIFGLDLRNTGTIQIDIINRMNLLPKNLTPIGRIVPVMETLFAWYLYHF